MQRQRQGEGHGQGGHGEGHGVQRHLLSRLAQQPGKGQDREAGEAKDRRVPLR